MSMLVIDENGDRDSDSSYFDDSDFEINDEENECQNTQTVSLHSYQSISSKDDLILTEKRESYLSQMSAISTLSTLQQNGETMPFGLSSRLSRMLKRNKNKNGGELMAIKSRSNTQNFEESDEDESSSTNSASTSGEEYQIYANLEYKQVNIDQIAMCLQEDEEYYYEDDEDDEQYVD